MAEDREDALLLACLRREPLALGAPVDWPLLLKRAEDHGLLLILYESLDRARAEIPTFFRTAAHSQWLSAQTLAVALEAVLALLTGIEIIPPKGPVLAEFLYGDVALRPSNDLDLLVHSEDFAQAENLLLAGGFTASDDEDDYHRMFLRNGVAVELHRHLASPRGLRLEGFWSRTTPSRFRSQPIRELFKAILLSTSVSTG